jgi:hypothetical protein
VALVPEAGRAEGERDSTAVADATGNAGVAPCGMASPSSSPIDVYLRFSDTGGPNPGTALAVTVPSQSIKMSVITLHGPVECHGAVQGQVLSWRCMTDMGSISGEAEVVGDAIVVREGEIDMDAFSALLPGPDGAPRPRRPPPMKETHRAPWPCGVRAKLHPSSVSTIPKD